MSIEHHGLVVPSSPEDRKRLKGGLDEMVDCLTKISAIREHQKQVVAHLHEEFDIPKKLLTKAARTMFEDNYQKVAAEAEDFDTLVETLKLNGMVVQTND